jgi:hypothetical protein
MDARLHLRDDQHDLHRHREQREALVNYYWPDVKAGWADAHRTPPRLRLRTLIRVGGWDYRLGFLAGILS